MADGNGSVTRYDSRRIAKALGISKRGVELRANRESWCYSTTTGRGGQRRMYALADLPGEVQTALLLASNPATKTQRPAAGTPTRAQIESLWDRFESVAQPLKDTAQQRLRAVQAVDALVQGGTPLMVARDMVATQMQRENIRGAGPASIARWQKLVARHHRSDWLAVLVPRYTGRTAMAEIEPQAWEIFKADYLRVEQPSAESVYRRLQRIATINPDWAPLPSVRTFMRRIERELPRPVIILAREGTEAMRRTFPAQERDRSVFGALEGVNADGHVWDVAVRLPNGSIGRPIIVGWQDLRSGKILAWRMAETESSDLVRLSFCDMVRTWGIPGHAWLDNGRSFAAKNITGGAPNRYRFKVQPEDPVGVITGLGTQVHWTTPYHGQAKPIERAWRDFCDAIAKHPEFAGAYMGNNPMAKPENYGSRAVPWETFVATVDAEIAAHNARPGRTGKGMEGRSFDEVFAQSYATTPIRKATEAQLRLMLLAAEAVHASRDDGAVRLSGNRYWSEALAPHAGTKVVLRFDPLDLHDGVHVYALDQAYIGWADCIASVGFADSNAAREHKRAKRQYSRANRQMLDAERRMDVAQVAAQLPTPVPPDLPRAGVIAPVFGDGKKPVRPVAEAEPLARTGTDDAAQASLDDFMKRIQEQQARERL